MQEWKLDTIEPKTITVHVVKVSALWSAQFIMVVVGLQLARICDQLLRQETLP
ncbi:hypothetical protein D3C81_1133320 [compost metagenome]